MIDVVWFNENPDAIARGFWDQGWLEEILAGRLWRPPGPVEFRHLSVSELEDGRGAVLVVPARWHAGRENAVKAIVDRLSWCLLVLTGDEENVFNRMHFTAHSDVTRVWVQTPRPDTVREGERFIGDMCPPDVRQLDLMTWDKDLDWFFAGQVNTEDRATLTRMLATARGGRLTTTDTFGAGLAYEKYLSELARAKLALCPGGPFTPDTFRFFEALEAGCAPVFRADPYWELLGAPPGGFTDSWHDALNMALRQWPHNATDASCWYQRHKRELARRFYDDLRELAGEPGEGDDPLDQVTVLMPTSSAPGDPDTAIIEETMSSLPAGMQVIVMMDGLHGQHVRRKREYAEYRRRVAWLCEHRWPNALPLYFPQHRHQAAMTSRALDDVHTPLVLFVEHDAPLVGEIPWRELVAAVRSGRADMIRLHHEASILPDHEHLMREFEVVEGAPLRRTVQWSQRPHLANTSFYRRVLAERFTPSSRTMIEDVLHGAAQDPGWDGKLWLYHPDGDIKRSTHLDARAGEPKVPMTF